MPTAIGLLYTWVASKPATACANGASLSAYKAETFGRQGRGGSGHAGVNSGDKKVAWRLFQYNVSKDCRYRAKTFDNFTRGCLILFREGIDK